MSASFIRLGTERPVRFETHSITANKVLKMPASVAYAPSG